MLFCEYSPNANLIIFHKDENGAEHLGLLCAFVKNTPTGHPVWTNDILSIQRHTNDTWKPCTSNGATFTLQNTAIIPNDKAIPFMKDMYYYSPKCQTIERCQQYFVLLADNEQIYNKFCIVCFFISHVLHACFFAFFIFTFCCIHTVFCNSKQLHICVISGGS